MTEAFLVILLLALVVVGMFVLPKWRMNRVISQVIQIFREHSAFSIKSARTGDELGFRRQGMMEGILTRRDYKRYALMALIKAEIIQTTEDGRLYLSEERLISSKIYKSQSALR